MDQYEFEISNESSTKTVLFSLNFEPTGTTSQDLEIDLSVNVCVYIYIHPHIIYIHKHTHIHTYIHTIHTYRHQAEERIDQIDNPKSAVAKCRSSLPSPVLLVEERSHPRQAEE